MSKSPVRTIEVRTLLFWGMAILLVVLLLRSCGTNFGGLFGGGKADTIKVKSDTVWMITQGDTVYTPLVNTVTRIIEKNGVVYTRTTDTLEIFHPVSPTDTAAIIDHFFQKATYIDTVSNNDSALAKYGTFIVYDTVHQNRIVKRRVASAFKIPEVTNTITLREKRNVVYVGASAIGTPASPLLAIGGDLSIKTKTDRIYGIGAYATKEGVVYYQASYRVPIRLKRK